MPNFGDVIREATQEVGYTLAEEVGGTRVYTHPDRPPLVIRGKDTDRVGPVTLRGIKARLGSR